MSMFTSLEIDSLIKEKKKTPFSRDQTYILLSGENMFQKL